MYVDPTFIPPEMERAIRKKMIGKPAKSYKIIIPPEQTERQTASEHQDGDTEQ